jgi:hypothetical protein
MRFLGAGIFLATMAAAGSSLAGAWPTPAGETQAIFKYEGSEATSGFDPSGVRQPIAKLRDDSLSVFIEHGLTSRLTLQIKAGATEGSDQFIHYSGRGPVEIGLRYAVYDGSLGVLSVYAGAIAAGVGRNAGYAPPHAGEGDVELRVLAGRNAKLWDRPLFGEVQVARLFRRGLPDETHIDLTLGWEPAPHWLVLAQSYAGRAESSPVAPEWAKVEGSVVRRLGPWAVQLGWREAAWGREAPREHGPVIGVWRRF